MLLTTPNKQQVPLSLYLSCTYLVRHNNSEAQSKESLLPLLEAVVEPQKQGGSLKLFSLDTHSRKLYVTNLQLFRQLTLGRCGKVQSLGISGSEPLLKHALELEAPDHRQKIQGTITRHTQ